MGASEKAAASYHPGFGDVDIAAAERVRAVMDFNDATRLPYGGRACSCPHGTGSEACCVQQLGLG